MIEEMARRYVAGESSVAIGRDYRLSPAKVLDLLRDHGVTVRRQGKIGHQTPLDDRLVEALEPTEKRYSVTDPSLPGFQIRVNANGTKTAAVLYYLRGRQRRVTLGRLCETYTFAQARADAVAALAAVKAGQDPAATKRARKELPTFGAIARRFIAERAEKWSPDKLRKAKISLKMHVLPAIGSLWVHEVTKPDIEEIVRRIEGAGDARAAINLCSSIMQKAEEWGARPANSNPCPGVAIAVAAKQDRLNKAEFQDRVHAAMVHLHNGHGDRRALLSTWIERLIEAIGDGSTSAPEGAEGVEDEQTGIEGRRTVLRGRAPGRVGRDRDGVLDRREMDLARGEALAT